MPRTGPGGSEMTATSPPRDLAPCHPQGTDIPVCRGWDVCDDSKASPERWRGGGDSGEDGGAGLCPPAQTTAEGPMQWGFLPRPEVFPSKPCDPLGFLAPI